MGRTISKNAVKGVRDVHRCPCGGTLHMVTVFRKGKLEHEARCTDCDKHGRNIKSIRESAPLRP